MVLIDTSAWIFALKKNFHPFVKERIEQILMESDVAINGIISLELHPYLSLSHTRKGNPSACRFAFRYNCKAFRFKGGKPCGSYKMTDPTQEGVIPHRICCT